MLSLGLLPITGAESGVDGDLLIPHSYDLFWGTVGFCIVALVMWKFAVPKFIQILDERTEKIAGGLQAAERAQNEIAQEREKLEEELYAARKDSAQVRKEAQEAAAKTANQIHEDAEAEARRIIDAAARQIEQDRYATAHALRGYVGDIAVGLAGRILEESVNDKDLQSRVIDRFLDELEAEGKQAANSGVKES